MKDRWCADEVNDGWAFWGGDYQTGRANHLLVDSFIVPNIAAREFSKERIYGGEPVTNSRTAMGQQS